MKEFLYCIIYFMATGFLGFILGRLLPKSWFLYDGFPYRCAKFERGGALYDKMNIHKWQTKLPDMSRLVPWAMPAKNLKTCNSSRLLTMIQETCIAEFIHWMLCITGLGSFFILQNPFCVLLYLIYVLVFNIPFIIIQRYNRPRLLHLRYILLQREKKKNTKETQDATSYS